MALPIEFAIEFFYGSPLDKVVFTIPEMFCRGHDILVHGNVVGKFRTEGNDVIKGCIYDVRKTEEFLPGTDLVTTVNQFGCLGCNGRCYDDTVLESRIWVDPYVLPPNGAVSTFALVVVQQLGDSSIPEFLFTHPGSVRIFFRSVVKNVKSGIHVAFVGQSCRRGLLFIPEIDNRHVV